MSVATCLLGCWPTASAFAGFEGNTLVRLAGGGWWVQDGGPQWHHFELRPLMEVWSASRRYWMSAVGHDVTRSVRPVQCVAEGRVQDVFRGWSGHTSVYLEDGQIWVQCDAVVRTRYVLRPHAWVFLDEGEYWMEVANTRARVLAVPSGIELGTDRRFACLDSSKGGRAAPRA